jgi:preprotein translocase subunit SecF
MELVRHRRWFFSFSAILVAVSIIALIIPPALKPGIDFTGGTAMTVQFDKVVDVQLVRDRLQELGHDGANVQPFDSDSAGTTSAFFIRTGELEPEVLNDAGEVTEPGGKKDIEEGLGSLADVQVTSFDAVSAAVGAETVRNAIIAVIVAAIAVLLFVTWAFRHVPNPFRYGATAIIALIHDSLIVLGVFSILGKVMDMEVNAMFITGVLTVIGYSVNDTIVVFDRVRENVARFQGLVLEEVVSLSVRETIGRSLNTSLTLMVVIVALFLFGGSTIQPLLLVLLVGVIVGTYSSIFTASLLLIAWETGELGRLVRRLPLVPSRP